MAQPDEIILDFSKVARHRHRRSKRDVKSLWTNRLAYFIKAGFTSEEATWAADSGVGPRTKGIPPVVEHRKNLIAFYMQHGDTREQAIEKAGKDLETKLEKYGEEELNLFYEVSP